MLTAPVTCNVSPVHWHSVYVFSFFPPEPSFVYMDMVPESEHSTDGDDDKVYLFFSENAVEYDFFNKLMVSRVARVCKVGFTHSLTDWSTCFDVVSIIHLLTAVSVWLSALWQHQHCVIEI